MRELKVLKLPREYEEENGCSPNPYDEGTERSPTSHVPPAVLICCSPNPYDEGTESSHPVGNCTLNDGCSPNPYDEGTESCRGLGLIAVQGVAAAQIPMMRELKVSFICRMSLLICCCSPNPYDEGTESISVAQKPRSIRTLQPKSL